MKPLVVSIILLFSFYFGSCQEGTQTETPSAVKETFKNLYPGENDPDWHLDAHGNYESNFKIEGIKYRADFAPSGEWIETESSIDVKELPKVIQDRIKQEYDDYEITEVERVEHATKGLFFDVEFKQKGKNKDVEFSPSGEILN